MHMTMTTASYGSLLFLFLCFPSCSDEFPFILKYPKSKSAKNIRLIFLAFRNFFLNFQVFQIYKYCVALEIYQAQVFTYNVAIW